MLKRAVPRAAAVVLIINVGFHVGVTAQQAAVGQDAVVSGHVGMATLRVNTEKLEIGVYQRGRPELPYFTELAVVTPDVRKDLKTFVGRSIAFIRSNKHVKEWDVYADVWAGGELTLAENIFLVKQVLVSSRKYPVELKVDRQVYTLKLGDALLVLK